MGNRKLVANLKMNLDFEEVQNYLKVMDGKVQSSDVIFCPSALYLPYFTEKGYKVGIQNISYKDAGSYTGEISARQAKSVGVSYVLIGHSERRCEFGETDAQILKKVKLALQENLQVILCVGEGRREEDYKEVLLKQITSVLDFVNPSPHSIWIAYEPVWAIGSGRMPAPSHIREMAQYIRGILETKYHIKPYILYGGSITEDTIYPLCEIKEVDGFLIGSASASPSAFLKIIEVAVTM